MTCSGFVHKGNYFGSVSLWDFYLFVFTSVTLPPLQFNISNFKKFLKTLMFIFFILVIKDNKKLKKQIYYEKNKNKNL